MTGLACTVHWRCNDVMCGRRWTDERGRLHRHPYEPTWHPPQWTLFRPPCWCGAEEGHRIHQLCPHHPPCLS